MENNEKKKEDAWKSEGLIKALLQGGTAVMPTDTIYGIVARAQDERAVDRLYEIRERNKNKPFIILIGEVGQLEKFSISLSAQQKKVLEEYWPGQVSVILDCPGESFAYLHRGTHTLAFRLPESAGLRELLLKTGPIAAPSANAEGAAPASAITEAKKYFGEKVDFYADGGELSGRPSKIIRLNAEGIVSIIRP